MHHHVSKIALATPDYQTRSVFFHKGLSGFFPAKKASLQVTAVQKTNFLRSLSGKCGPPRACTIKDEDLVFGKNRFVIWTFRIDPEFKHSARRMQCPIDHPVPLQFAYIANVHKLNVVFSEEFKGLVLPERFDVPIGSLDEVLYRFSRFANQSDAAYSLTTATAEGSIAPKIEKTANAPRKMATAQVVTPQHDF